MYFLQETTEAEQITQFALENWWLADHMSLLTQTPSQFFIQTVEASEIIAIDKSREEAEHPKLTAALIAWICTRKMHVNWEKPNNACIR